MLGLTVSAPESFVPFDLSETNQSIASRFEKIARTWPDRLAVKAGTISWSYVELDSAADVVAMVVRAKIAASPQPVAILLRQGPQLLASILGVLKAGHFYVPLDPSHPRAALAHLLGDCGARLIITDTARLVLATDLVGEARTVNTDALARRPSAMILPSVRVKPDALACIYYTSGSTGRPKGVMDTHRNVLHNVLRYTNGLRISPDDRLSLVQAPTFSGVMSSQFGALLNGASVFPFDTGGQGLAGIGPWLFGEAITIYHSVPAIFRHFLRAVDDAQLFPNVRVVRLEGDAATHADVSLFRRHFTDRAVLAHGLGATECGLVRRFVITRHTPIDSGVVPIGYRVDDVRVRIVDEAGEETARGEIGEIVVESSYLSPGYWKQPELTAAVFSEGFIPGTRQYRTGDVGRMRNDGCVEYLGRKDSQPKVRGERVDVEAIETALLATGMVRDAVVIVRSASDGEPRLLAYVVPAQGSDLSVTMLRQELSTRLPAAQMPSRFVVLAALPVNSSHKIDRDALPAPPPERPALDAPFIAPRTALESMVADAWASVLGLDQVGIRDNFFDLGGDSLDAMTMSALLARTVGHRLPPIAIFESPTVEQFARAIEARVTEISVERPHEHEGAGSLLVRVQPSGSRTPFFFLHAEYGGDGFYCLNVARHVGVDQPFFGLSPFGRDGESVPSSIEAMAAAYLAIVRKQQPRGPYSIGGFCSCAVVAWEMARQLRASGDDVQLLVLIEPPAIESGVVARTVHSAADVAVRLGAPAESRAEFVCRGMDIARLRPLRRFTSTVLKQPRAVGPIRFAGMSPSDRKAAIAATYRRAVVAYLPRPYDGAVLCLQANDGANDRVLEEWKRVAPALSARRVPGNHDSCIVTNARALGQTLADALRVIPFSLSSALPLRQDS